MGGSGYDGVGVCVYDGGSGYDGVCVCVYDGGSGYDDVCVCVYDGVLINLTVWKDSALVVCFHSRLLCLSSFFMKIKTEKLQLISVLFLLPNICYW